MLDVSVCITGGLGNGCIRNECSRRDLLLWLSNVTMFKLDCLILKHYKKRFLVFLYTKGKLDDWSIWTFILSPGYVINGGIIAN